MTMHIPRLRNLACTGRSVSRDGYTAVPRSNLRAWAMLAALAVILIVQLGLVSALRAEDRKTREISFVSLAVYGLQTAYSSAFDVSAYTEAQIFVNVTTEVSACTLTVTIETSPNNIDWYTHTTLSAITATENVRSAITNFGKYIRIKHVTAGSSSSFTYQISGTFKN
jgi:hypothetical protein